MQLLAPISNAVPCPHQRRAIHLVLYHLHSYFIFLLLLLYHPTYPHIFHLLSHPIHHIHHLILIHAHTFSPIPQPRTPLTLSQPSTFGEKPSERAISERFVKIRKANAELANDSTTPIKTARTTTGKASVWAPTRTKTPTSTKKTGISKSGGGGSGRKLANGSGAKTPVSKRKRNKLTTTNDGEDEEDVVVSRAEAEGLELHSAFKPATTFGNGRGMEEDEEMEEEASPSKRAKRAGSVNVKYEISDDDAGADDESDASSYRSESAV